MYSNALIQKTFQTHEIMETVAAALADLLQDPPEELKGLRRVVKTVKLEAQESAPQTPAAWSVSILNMSFPAPTYNRPA